MEAKTTKRQIAMVICESAVQSGATSKMLRDWCMMSGDCDYVRSTMPESDDQDVRAAILDVEDEVRRIGRECLEIEAA